MTTLQALQVGSAVEHIVARLIEDVIEAVSISADLALNDPLGTLLLVVGTVLILFSSAVFFGLSGGGVLGWFFRLAE